MTEPRWSDEQVDVLIGTILQAGVLLAGMVVLAGGILYLIQYGLTPADYRTFDSQRAAIHGLLPILAAAARLDGRAIIQTGILMLIATPVLRVVFSVVAFALQRDRLYVPVTLVVLGILIYGLFFA